VNTKKKTLVTAQGGRGFSLCSGSCCSVSLYRVRGVLAPFILAFALSYLMNPVVTHLEKRGAPRGLGTLVIYVGFTLAITLFVLYLVPKFLVQLERLGEVLPQQAGSIQSEIAGFYKRFSRFNIPEPVKAQSITE